MRLGFTGTRESLTDEQEASLREWIGSFLNLNLVEEFHHGCCFGADEASAAIVIFSQDTITLVAHPPINSGLLSDSSLNISHIVRDRRDFLTRNRDIVNDTDHLLACPKGDETLRSGTWSTIRYAKKCGKPVTVIWPDGRIEEQR